MQCFPSPGGSRVHTRASVSYLWRNVSPLPLVTVSLLVLCLLPLVQCFTSPGGSRVLTRASVSYLWRNVSPLPLVTVSLLVLLSVTSGAMFPLSWW